MEIDSPIHRALRLSPSGNRSKQDSAQLQLRKGEVVQVKVLKKLSQNTALLLIKGKQVSAKTHTPLQEGRTVSLITETVSPVPSFKPLGTPLKGPQSVHVAVLLSALKNNIWKTTLGRISHLGLSPKYIALLKGVLQQITLQPFTRITPEFIKAFIAKSGLGWEAKLRKLLNHRSIRAGDIGKLLEGDLKGLASKLLAFEGGNRQLEELVTVIRAVQLLNQKGLDQGRKLFFPLPVQFPNDMSTVAQVLIHLPEKEAERSGRGENGEETMRVALQLTLSGLGPIRADLYLKGKTVTGNFLMSKKETKSIIEDKLPLLVDSLATNGFAVSQFICHLTDPQVVQQPLFTEIIPTDDGSLSVVA
ncbi:MAG: flagellar hook-length control protein FliK [Desulfobacterales bacterium]